MESFSNKWLKSWEISLVVVKLPGKSIFDSKTNVTSILCEYESLFTSDRRTNMPFSCSDGLQQYFYFTET